jgi:hypothetical protein
MGRSYQLIATACKDHFVRIFKLTEISATQSNPPQTPQSRNASQSKMNLSPSASPNQSQVGKRYNVEVLAAFDDHQAEVRKHIAVWQPPSHDVALRLIMIIGMESGMEYRGYYPSIIWR